MLVSIDEAPLTSSYPSRVLVATLYGKSYYKIVSALKSIGVPFDSVSPEEAAVMNSSLIITTELEQEMIGKKRFLLDTELDGESSLIRAKILRSLSESYQHDELVIGIDPGNSTGIAVFYLETEIESKVLNSIRKTVELVSILIDGIESSRKTVRIGYGNPLLARQIANRLHFKFGDYIAIEFVDEHGTSTRAMNVNRRGLRDRLSAKAIAFRRGRLFKPVISIKN